MNKIDALIAELCPNDVEFLELGDVGQLIRGNGLQKTDFIESGVGCIHYGQIYTYYGIFAYKTKSFVSPELSVNLKKVEKNDLIIATTSENLNDVCKTVAWLGEDEIITGGHATILKHNQNAKYLAYYFQTQDFYDQKKKYARGTKVIEIKATDIAKIKIPIPPLPIQQEIVNILDKFTQLQAELEVELQARRKQYKYYLNELFNYEKKVTNFEIKWVNLGDICIIGDGLHGTPNYNNSGKYYFINGNNLSGGKISFANKTKKVDDSIYKKYGILFSIESTVFMSINGTIGNVSIYNNENVVLGKSVAYFNVKSKCLNSKYLFYLLQTDFAKEYYESQKTGSTIKNLGLKSLREFKIGIPSIEEQQNIVAILDKFDKLVNDTSEGLPAEIEARKKQYEYYRGKLLNFNRTDNGKIHSCS